MQNAGCFACHIVGPHGTHSTVGPELTNLAEVAGERMTGMKAREYIRRSILYPNEFIAPACPDGPCLGNIMPSYYGERLTAGELELLLDYLLVGDWLAEEPQDGVDAGESVATVITPTSTPPPPDSNQPNSPLTSPYLWLIISFPLLILLLRWLVARTKRAG